MYIENHTLRILEIIRKNPRTSPKLIHAQMKDILNKSYIQYLLRALRELSLVESPQQGMYLITKKGLEALRPSDDNTEDMKEKCGYGVSKEEIGSTPCVGCHFIMVDNTCSWTEEDGVRDLSGPTSHPGPLRSSEKTQTTPR